MPRNMFYFNAALFCVGSVALFAPIAVAQERPAIQDKPVVQEKPTPMPDDSVAAKGDRSDLRGVAEKIIEQFDASGMNYRHQVYDMEAVSCPA